MTRGLCSSGLIQNRRKEMVKVTYHYTYGPTYTVRLHRSLFKKLYAGGKLARYYRKGISGYHVPAL